MARNSTYPPSVTPGIPHLGEKPVGWIQTTYGDVLDKVARKAEVQDEHKYQLVTAKRSRGGIVPRSQLFGKEIKTETQFYIHTNDFLISKRQIIHGACGVVPDNLDGAVVSGEYSVLQVRNDLLLDYLKYHCHTIYFQQTCFQSSVGVDVEKMIFDLDQWLKFKVYLPPLHEQHKIADILSTWDEVIDLTEQSIAAKQRHKQALTQRMLTGKLRFSQFILSQKTQQTPFGKLPADWQYVPIISIAEQSNSFNYSDLALPVLSCTKYDGLVDSLKYFGRQMFSEDLSKYKIVNRSQFAYATNHIEEGSIGYQNLYDAALVSPMYTVFQTNGNQVCDGFLYRVLKTEKYRRIFEMNTNGSVNRRGSLRWNEFSKIEVPLPSLAEQQKIAAALDIFDDELNLLQQKLTALRQQKQGLMQQLLTGKIRVKV